MNAAKTRSEIRKKSTKCETSTVVWYRLEARAACYSSISPLSLSFFCEWSRRARRPHNSLAPLTHCTDFSCHDSCSLLWAWRKEEVVVLVVFALAIIDDRLASVECISLYAMHTIWIWCVDSFVQASVINPVPGFSLCNSLYNEFY